ncbi:MAG: VOC family protein [Bacteroidota bacterium]
MAEIKYVHTNLIARDWKKLAKFYIDVFGCKEKKPDRNLKGQWLDDLTGIKDARIKGIHLLLPGYDENGPTLEIFQYNENEKNTNKKINVEGLGHTAFAVDDVDRCLANVIKNGGSTVGKLVKGTVEGVGEIYVVYAKDPEGNIIELQKWD